MHARLRGRRGESARPTISHTQCHGGSQCDVITSLLRRCLIAVSTAYISDFSTTTLCLEFAKHYATVMIWRTPRRRRFKRKQRQTDIYASPSSFRESVNETVGLLASECRGEFRQQSAAWRWLACSSGICSCCSLTVAYSSYNHSDCDRYVGTPVCAG